MTNLGLIQRELTRYGITIYLILGILGNIFNCIIFTHRRFRFRPSSIYFLSLSILAIVHLIWSVAPFLYTLNYPDHQIESLVYCKIRVYISHATGQCLRYIVILACIDRYLVACGAIRFHQLHSLTFSINLVLVVCLCWFVSSIHLPILWTIRDGVCSQFDLYKLIFVIYRLIFSGILPPILMSLLNILTIRTVHRLQTFHTRRKPNERYLLRMVIAEVMINIFTSIPYSIHLIYQAATHFVSDKTIDRLEIESFLSFIAQLFIYLNNVAPFYLFVIASKPFRDHLMNLFKCSYRQIRITPLNHQ